MPSAQGIRAGRAFVELFADDTKLVRGLRRAERRVKAFGKRISQLGRKLAGIGAGPFSGTSRNTSKPCAPRRVPW
jgi:hypothetical protein